VHVSLNAASKTYPVPSSAQIPYLAQVLVSYVHKVISPLSPVH
jgi:hypothetical protein